MDVVESGFAVQVQIVANGLDINGSLSTLHPGLQEGYYVGSAAVAGALDSGSVVDGFLALTFLATELSFTDVSRSQPTITASVEK